MIPSSIFGLAAVFLAWGSYLGISGAIDKNEEQATRVGRLLRASLIEGVGMILLLVGFATGGKVPVAIPALILGLGFGSSFGLFHVLLKSRSAKP
ncbi:MAG: hypothetical protein JST40_02535 [Armatimonadetes bacterium]|nr:hypothetical protein [Armatimonadota bacterium]